MPNNSIAFGSGVLWGTPATANSSPVQFGTLQDVSIDFSFSTKNLMGQFQFPVAVARGAGKISGKAKFANLKGALINSLFFGSGQSTGQKLTSYNEGAAIPASPFQVTVANAASFDQDLGVVYAANGVALTRVISAPSSGQYSVNSANGQYSFAAADTGRAILISYAYSQNGTGTRSVIGNPLMGIAPTFQIDFYQSNPNIAGAQWSLRLYSCMSSKLTFATKLEDFVVPELDFQAFANAANNVGELNFAE